MATAPPTGGACTDLDERSESRSLDALHEVALDALALGQRHNGLLPIGLLADLPSDPPRLAMHGRGVHRDDVDLERCRHRLRDLLLRRGLRDGEGVATGVRAGHGLLGDDRPDQDEIASHAVAPLRTAATSARAASSASAGRATSTVSAPSTSLSRSVPTERSSTSDRFATARPWPSFSSAP